MQNIDNELNIMSQKLEELERKGNQLILKYVQLVREKDVLCGKQSVAIEEIREIDERLSSVTKAIRFCNDFANRAKQDDGYGMQEKVMCASYAKAQNERRLKRLDQCNELEIHGEQKIIKVAQISDKVLEWLKTLMDIGVMEWEDRFALEICDRTWLKRAASERTINVCLELFWHLMLLGEVFPTKEMLVVLSTRTGTPSMEELTTILGDSRMNVWVQMTRQYVTTEKNVTELEFQAMLGDGDAKKRMMR